MAHAWKACWCNSLTSSNLVSSANRVLSEISKPFFMPKTAVFQRFWQFFNDSPLYISILFDPSFAVR